MQRSTTFLSLTGMSFAALMAFREHNSLKRRVFERDGIQMKRSRLWEPTEKWSLDDAHIAYGILGLLILPRVPRIRLRLNALSRWQRRFAYLGAASCGAPTGDVLGFVNFPYICRSRVEAWKASDKYFNELSGDKAFMETLTYGERQIVHFAVQRAAANAKREAKLAPQSAIPPWLNAKLFPLIFESDPPGLPPLSWDASVEWPSPSSRRMHMVREADYVASQIKRRLAKITGPRCSLHEMVKLDIQVVLLLYLQKRILNDIVEDEVSSNPHFDLGTLISSLDPDASHIASHDPKVSTQWLRDAQKICKRVEQSHRGYAIRKLGMWIYGLFERLAKELEEQAHEAGHVTMD